MSAERKLEIAGIVALGLTVFDFPINADIALGPDPRQSMLMWNIDRVRGREDALREALAETLERRLNAANINQVAADAANHTVASPARAFDGVDRGRRAQRGDDVREVLDVPHLDIQQHLPELLGAV